MFWARDMISTTCWVISPKRTCMSRRASARCCCVLAFDRRSSKQAFGLAWAASTSNAWVFDRTIFLVRMILVVRKAYSEGCGRGFFGTGVRLWVKLRIRLPEMATLPAFNRVPVPWAPHTISIAEFTLRFTVEYALIAYRIKRCLFCTRSRRNVSHAVIDKERRKGTQAKMCKHN